MVRYEPVDLRFEPYVGPNPRSTQVFVNEGRGRPIRFPLGKESSAKDSLRQAYFEEQLLLLSEVIGSRCVPTHIQWASGEQNQMDKGCIGHSFTSEHSFIESLARNFRDEITHLIIRTL